MAWSLHEGHLPAEALVDVSLGQPLSRARREVIESHLALCSQCAEELALLREDASREAVERFPWLRSAALAATVAAVVCATGWLYTARQLAEERVGPTRHTETAAAPRLNTPILELVPVAPGTTARNATLDAQGLVNTWDPAPLPEAEEEVVLTLLSGELHCSEGCTVEILRGDGTLVWQSAGLRATAAGHAALTLPRSLLPVGAWSVLVHESERPDEVIRYRIESP